MRLVRAATAASQLWLLRQPRIKISFDGPAYVCLFIHYPPNNPIYYYIGYTRIIDVSALLVEISFPGNCIQLNNVQ
jgi:hypothetical protein